MRQRRASLLTFTIIMKYLVHWDYEAAWKEGKLVLREGEEIQLDDDVAEHVSADSPGCITPIVAARAIVEAPQDRMVKTADTRDATTRKGKTRNERAPSEPITSTTFKAVKDKN